MWYLRDLIVVSFLSPAIYWAVKKLKYFYFIILAPLYLLNVWTIIPGLGLSSFIFFGLGVYLAIYKGSLNITENKCYKIFILISAIFIASTSAYLWLVQGVTTFNYSIYTLATILLVAVILIIGRMASVGGLQVNRMFVESSFFVYAFHDFTGINPITLVKKIVRVLQVESSILIYLLTPFIVYGISVVVYYIINRFMPRFTHLKPDVKLQYKQRRYFLRYNFTPFFKYIDCIYIETSMYTLCTSGRESSTTKLVTAGYSSYTTI